MNSSSSSGQPSNVTGQTPKKHDLWRGFEPYTPALLDAKRKTADWFNDGLDRGEALVLAGPRGSGKTHLALVVLGAYGAPHMAFMIGEADLVQNIRASYDGDGSEKMILANYRRAPLFILDDIGVAHVKPESLPWLHDIYWRLFDRRAELRLPTLVTTNLTLEQLPARLGPRAFSRLSGMMGGPGNYVDLAGVPDYRLRNWE